MLDPCTNVTLLSGISMQFRISRCELFLHFSPWHLLHFLAFQKPAAQLKKPSVESAQKKTQESESSDSDSDDESDEVICLWIHMLYLSVDLITFDRCLC